MDLIIKEKQYLKNDKKYVKLKIINNSDNLITKIKIKTSNEEKIIDVMLYPNHQIKQIIETNESPTIEILEENEIKDRKKAIDMTNGNIKKKMILFAIPIFLSALLQSLYNSIDSLIVGKFIGKEALAAVSSSGNLIFLFTSFFLGASQGAGVLIAKLFGAKQFKNMSKAIHTNVTIGLISSLILTILGVSLTPQILRLMKTDPTVLPKSIDYFRFYFIGCTGIIMYNVLSGILNAVGNSNKPLIFLGISSVLNVLLDLFFIGLLKQDVRFAAIATTISQFVSAILCLIYLTNVKSSYHLSFNRLELDKEKVKEILYYGIPTGLQNSVIGLANVFVQSNINTFGPDAMAGCGAYAKVENFVFVPITSFTMAISTFVGQNLGAKEYDRAKQGSRFGIICAMIMASIFGIILFSFAPFFINLFVDEEEMEVIRIGVLYSRITSPFFFLLAFSHSVASVCRGSGRPIIAMAVMLFIWCVVRVTYIYIALSISHQIILVFIAYPITWFISSIIYLIYYFKADWIHNFERKEKSLN